MKPVWIVLGVIALVVVEVGGLTASKWKQLVAMDTDIKAKWAQVDINSSDVPTSFQIWSRR